MVRGGVLATLLVMGACSGDDAAPEPAPTGGAEESPTETETQRTSEPVEVESLDPDSACGRAEACCHAFAAAIPNVVAQSACVGPREAHERADADRRCDAMRDGWREALTLRAGEAPDACR